MMSGTSLDGVDVAILETDGQRYVKPLKFLTQPYDRRLKDKVRQCFGLKDIKDPRVAEAARLSTFAHIDAARQILREARLDRSEIDIIGFHGQTITHDPKNKLSFQIGDGELMAKELGISVVNDFRSHDIVAGGEGAPLLPIYHQAVMRSRDIEYPVAILNIGGVANVTWIGDQDGDLMAFDTGPGNALIDDYLYTHRNMDYDEEGKIAKTGKVHQNILDSWMAMPFFSLPSPKSLDRNSWDISPVEYLPIEDGVATLTAFTVHSIKQAARLLPEKPKHWIVCGGGWHNKTMIEWLTNALGADLKSIADYGLNGDAVEAEGFAYMAVRHLKNLPITFPGTTGVKTPLVGGVLHGNKAE